MPALIHAATLEQGADFIREYTATDPVTGAPVDLSNHTISAPFKTMAGVKVLDMDSSINGNKVTVSIEESDNAALTPASTYTHYYTVTATSPVAPSYRLAKAKVLISAQ